MTEGGIAPPFGAEVRTSVMASAPDGITDDSAATLVPCKNVLRFILIVIGQVQLLVQGLRKIDTADTVFGSSRLPFHEMEVNMLG
jgi:hypothetical protein